MQDYAAIVKEARSRNKVVFSPLTATYQREKFKNAADGKHAISNFAIANNFNALVQSPKSAKREVLLHADNAHELLLNVVFGDQVSEGVLSRNRTLDANGKGSVFISHNISAFLSSSVDNEKEQSLHEININNTTYGVVNLLNQLGFTQDVIASFLSQDIMFDFVKAVEQAKTDGATVANAPAIAFEQIINNENYTVEDITEAEEEQKEKKLKKYKELGPKALFKVIEQGESHPHYRLTQLATLSKFMQLHEASGELKKLQVLSNTDSSGLGKNLLESKSREEAVE